MAPRVYSFGPFQLRADSRELYKLGVKLKLRSQPCRVLQLLLDRPGEVVGREVFRNQLWPSNTFVDFEQGLNTSIKELRAILCDSANEPRYVETLPKLGYRIIVPVKMTDDLAPNGSPATVAFTSYVKEGDFDARTRNIATAPSRRQPQLAGSRTWLLVLAISLVAVVALVVYQRSWRSHARIKTPTSRIMVAVLPFQNLTGDASQDYSSDGLTDEVIARTRAPGPVPLGGDRTNVRNALQTQQRWTGPDCTRIGRPICP